MGTLVQLKLPMAKQSDEPPAPSRSLCKYLSTFAEKLQAIESHRAAIENDMQIVQSIMLNTTNPELRARLLATIKNMHDQLLLVALSLLSVKQSIECGMIPSQT